MRNLRNTVNDGAEWLVELNRRVFSWIIEPLARVLEPHRKNFLVRNIPNGLSVGRCIAAVWVAWEVFQAVSGIERWPYVAVIAALIISDGFDGALARRLRIESRFGAMVDPFADKVLIGGLVVGLAIKFDSILFAELVAVLLFIELVTGLVGYYGDRAAKRLKSTERAISSSWGKVKFGGEGLLVFLGWVLFPLREVALSISLALIVLVIPLALRSLMGYIRGIRNVESAIAASKRIKPVPVVVKKVHTPY